MKKAAIYLSVVISLAASALGQHSETAGKAELNSKGEPVVKIKDNAPVNLKAGETIVRGDVLAKNVKKVKVEKVVADPTKFADRVVQVDGVIVSSCKKEGCWAVIADKADGKSVRVTFGDHKFFIPLNAAGLQVKAQGTFKTKTLPKEHVDHLIKDDGADPAKFARNADGSVTEVSFEATGVEMTKAKG